MIEINDKKSIGRVLFIVEGSKTEFAILRKIFCDILKYEYIEKRRNRPDTFKSRNNSTSKVAVRAILDYRRQNGAFRHVEDAVYVPGITSRIVESWQNLAYVS